MNKKDWITATIAAFIILIFQLLFNTFKAVDFAVTLIVGLAVIHLIGIFKK